MDNVGLVGINDDIADIITAPKNKYSVVGAYVAELCKSLNE